VRLHPAAWSLFFLLAAGIVAAAFVAVQGRETGTPAYSGPTIDGGTFDLSAERGRVVVLDFFNVYCDGCAILEKELQSLVPTWDPERVRVVSIGIAPSNTIDDLTTYARAHNLTWAVVSDPGEAVTRFSVIAMPTLVIVDPEGHIVHHAGGIPPASKIDHVVQTALAGDSGPVGFARYSLWGLAVVAAVASFFSPCAIGLLPGYVAHTVRFPAGGSSLRRAGAFGALAATGLLLVFLGVGGLAYVFGQAIGRYVGWLAPFMGAVFILVGLLLLLRPYSVALQRVFSPLTQVQPEAHQRGLGYFLYGVGYGAGAAGCTAPVLISLAALATNVGPVTGLALVGVYATSAALLMAVLTIVVAGGREGVAAWIRRHAAKVEIVSALAFVAGGAFLLWFAWRAGLFAL
jgi:cytochrome c-type biogenesis protein